MTTTFIFESACTCLYWTLFLICKCKNTNIIYSHKVSPQPMCRCFTQSWRRKSHTPVSSDTPPGLWRHHRLLTTETRHTPEVAVHVGHRPAWTFSLGSRPWSSQTSRTPSVYKTAGCTAGCRKGPHRVCAHAPGAWIQDGRHHTEVESRRRFWTLKTSRQTGGWGRGGPALGLRLSRPELAWDVDELRRRRRVGGVAGGRGECRRRARLSLWYRSRRRRRRGFRTGRTEG